MHYRSTRLLFCCSRAGYVCGYPRDTSPQSVLANTEFPDSLMALDSLHTQHETVQQILYDHGADYLLPLKGNQAGLLATAKTLLPEDFSP